MIITFLVNFPNINKVVWKDNKTSEVYTIE